MKFEYHNTDIEMRPGDQISIDIGMFHKCNIYATGDGKLRVSYGSESVLEI